MHSDRPLGVKAKISLRSTINVTPLADVMLVLLIIFMVITPLLGNSVEVDVPASRHSSEHPEDDETLILSLKGDGSIFLNRDANTREELSSALPAALSGRTEARLFLKVDQLID